MRLLSFGPTGLFPVYLPRRRALAFLLALRLPGARLRFGPRSVAVDFDSRPSFGLPGGRICRLLLTF